MILDAAGNVASSLQAVVFGAWLTTEDVLSPEVRPEESDEEAPDCFSEDGVWTRLRATSRVRTARVPAQPVRHGGRGRWQTQEAVSVERQEAFDRLRPRPRRR